MGMFDSLMIKIHEQEIELQTKRFENVLERYYLGEVIRGTSAGINIYFEVLHLDKKSQLTYQTTQFVSDYTVFIVLVHGVFTEYEVVDKKLEREMIERRIGELKELWSDNIRVTMRWLEFLHKFQMENQRLNYCVDRTLAVINYARRLKVGEDTAAKFSHLFKREEEKRLDQGEDLLDVLESALQKNATTEFWGYTKQGHDPLEDYRL